MVLTDRRLVWVSEEIHSASDYDAPTELVRSITHRGMKTLRLYNQVIELDVSGDQFSVNVQVTDAPPTLSALKAACPRASLGNGADAARR